MAALCAMEAVRWSLAELGEAGQHGEVLPYGLYRMVAHPARRAARFGAVGQSGGSAQAVSGTCCRHCVQRTSCGSFKLRSGRRCCPWLFATGADARLDTAEEFPEGSIAACSMQSSWRCQARSSACSVAEAVWQPARC